jgi:Uncharacterized protein conserved in bacteria (DUF2059)
LPNLRSRLSTLYVDQMAPDELQVAIDFYASSLGQRMVAMKNDEKGLDSLFTDMAKSEFVLTDKDLQKRNKGVADGFAKTAEKADIARLMIFASTPAFKKIQILGPKVSAITLEWTNNSSPEDEAAMDLLVVETMQAYMAKKTAKVGK